MVSTWLRTTLPFADRKKLGRVAGTPVAEAFAAADPAAARQIDACLADGILANQP